jgi:hypothetical protein
VKLQRHPRATAAIGLLLLVGTFCFTGWWGVDFGWHWDEWYHTKGLTKCFERMQLLPQDYIYNGMYFLLALPLLIVHLGPKLPAIVHELNGRTPVFALDVNSLDSVKALQTDATTLLGSGRYLLEARTLFLFVSAAAIVWVYLAMLRLFPRRYFAALAAAAFLALSWEYQYHARMIAIDAPLAQFAALQLLLLICAWQAAGAGRFAGWLAAAAVAGGIVLGCKTTGIFAVMPLVLLPWLRRDGWRWHQRMALSSMAGIVFFVTTFAVSPGMFLDPLHYYETMRYVAWDYNQQAGPSRTYYVANIGDHLGRVSAWFLGSVPAPSLWRALPVAAVAVFGLVVLFRRHRRLIIAWGAFAAALFAFLSTNHLLIVRQYLVFIPLMAIAFGAGVTQLRFRIRDARVRALLTVALVIGFALNGRWLFASAHSVRTTTADTIKAELVADLLGKRRRVMLTKRVNALIASEIAGAYRCAPADVFDYSQRSVIMYYGDSGDVRANRPYALERAYSSHEVNYDWYSSWGGYHSGDRILRYPIDMFTSLRIALPDTFDCVPL